MDLIIQLIAFLIRELGKEAQPNKAPSSQPNMRMDVRAAPPRPAPALAPRTKTIVQNPVDDGEGWRRLFMLLGIIALVVIVAAWAVYMLSLSGG